MHEREAARQNAPGDSEAALVQRARAIGLLAAPSRKP
jgi:hypothetical protein